MQNPILQNNNHPPQPKRKATLPECDAANGFPAILMSQEHVYHCHILDHEGQAMMAKIQVEP